LTPSSKKPRLKAVLDTNVWISAMLWGGLPAEIMKAAEGGRVTLLLSEGAVEEMSRVLSHDRLRKVYEGAGVSREELVERALSLSRVVKVKTKLGVVLRDPSDDKFLECAVDGGADYLVSGDEHLLEIKEYRGIEVLTAREFVEILKGSSTRKA
jgi:putative PIN family toxin of toxin-antitoxin system